MRIISTRCSGHQIVGPVGHLHLWSNSEGKLKDQMSDRSLESSLCISGHRMLNTAVNIASTEKYDLPMDLSDCLGHSFPIKFIITLEIL